MLTQSEIDAIKQEAEKLLPIYEFDGVISSEDINYTPRQALIMKLSEERQRAKVLAKKEAIDFEEWKRSNHIEWNGKHGEGYYWKVAGEPLRSKPTTPTQLYNIFINTYNKNKP